MPRTPREKSPSGIYHIMMRGINRQSIFSDDEDNEKFLTTLSDCKELCGFELYGYCLMGNHVHLLLKEADEDIGQIVKRISSRYVIWFNRKYMRSGHLFQERFKSEAINNDKYFVTILRYIHTKRNTCPLAFRFAHKCNKLCRSYWCCDLYVNTFNIITLLFKKFWLLLLLYDRFRSHIFIFFMSILAFEHCIYKTCYH